MALISPGEARWRMVRRALGLDRFGLEDVRSMSRHDRPHLDWLVANGHFEPAGADLFALTEKGRAAAHLGFYEV